MNSFPSRGLENSSTFLIKDKRKVALCHGAALLTQECSTCCRIIKRITTAAAGKSFGLVICLGSMQSGLSKDDLLKI